MKTSQPTPLTSTVAWVGNAATSLPSRKVIIRLNASSFRLQHKRKIDMFAFDDVEAICGKSFPVRGRIWKNGGRAFSWQNHQTRSGFLDKFSDAFLIQWRHPATHTGSKIPDQARFLKINGAEFHLRLQIVATLPVKLRGGKESSG